MRMDYSRFRFVTVVDWVELEVRTIRPTQGMHLKNAGGGAFSHAHGINPETGEKYDEPVKNTTSTRFAIRIQAPERFASVTGALRVISERLDPAFAVAVRGMEVALDAYAKDGTSAEELAELAAHFLKGINRVSPDHPRAYRRTGETRAIASRRELVQALLEGFQIGIGSGDGVRFQHGYVKTADSGQALPDEQHRARIEIRLQGYACPAQTLEDLAGFDFSTLSDYFRFRQFDEPRSDLDRLMADRQICLGNVIGEDGALALINRKGGGTRRNKRGTKASPLNGIARASLRSLTKRWRASAGRGKSRRPTPIACGNMDRFDQAGAVLDHHAAGHLLQPETPHQCWGNQVSRVVQERPFDTTSKNRPLNTSYPHRHPVPIKVACGITPHADLLPVLHDLYQADYPGLPDLVTTPSPAQGLAGSANGTPRRSGSCYGEEETEDQEGK